MVELAVWRMREACKPRKKLVGQWKMVYDAPNTYDAPKDMFYGSQNTFRNSCNSLHFQYAQTIQWPTEIALWFRGRVLRKHVLWPTEHMPWRTQYQSSAVKQVRLIYERGV